MTETENTTERNSESGFFVMDIFRDALSKISQVKDKVSCKSSVINIDETQYKENSTQFIEFKGSCLGEDSRRASQVSRDTANFHNKKFSG